MVELFSDWVMYCWLNLRKLIVVLEPRVRYSQVVVVSAARLDLLLLATQRYIAEVGVNATG